VSVTNLLILFLTQWFIIIASFLALGAISKTKLSAPEYYLIILCSVLLLLAQSCFVHICFKICFRCSTASYFCKSFPELMLLSSVSVSFAADSLLVDFSSGEAFCDSISLRIAFYSW